MKKSEILLSVLAGSFIAIFGIGIYAISGTTTNSDLGSGEPYEIARSDSYASLNGESESSDRDSDVSSDNDMNERISEQSISSNLSSNSGDGVLLNGGRKKRKRTNKRSNKRSNKRTNKKSNKRTNKRSNKKKYFSHNSA